MREIFISFDKVSKAFGALTVVDELDLAMAKVNSSACSARRGRAKRRS